ncbi:methionine synthase [Candidatus Riflebacteria bacterium]
MNCNRIEKLKELLLKRVLVLDGATGTALQQKNLTTVDFGSVEFEGCNENLVLTRPDVIRSVHESYLKAGADIIETNSFGGTPLVLAEYGLDNNAFQLNFHAARLAREMADKYSTPEKPRFVAGSVGPTTRSISVTGGIDFLKLKEHFFLQIEGLVPGGVDFLLIETCQDTLNIKAALLAIRELEEKLNKKLSRAVSITIESTGTMLAGQTVEAMFAALAHEDLLFIGMNCATGPEFMTDHIRALATLSPFPIACVPNAGLPDEEGNYHETPQQLTKILERFIDNGWLNIIGGCCGTTAEYTAEMVRMVDGKKARTFQPAKFSFLSGLDFLALEESNRPIIVGERTNVIGSRKFKKLIHKEKFEKACEIARAQVKKGAMVIDICLADPDRDEIKDMARFMRQLCKMVKVPFMIDSTDEKAIEVALRWSQGKAIINSINLEQGEERFLKVVPLAKKYGAALIVGCIDEDPVQGMAIDRNRKLQIAQRAYELLLGKYNFPEEDIYFDPLVFPCATGDENFLGSAVETIEGLGMIKKEFPNCKSLLGISNVSFGLPPAGREVLNSVFLYHCTEAGLDMAIVNSEKLERFATLAEEEKTLAEDLLWNRGNNPLDPFVTRFAGKKTRITGEMENLSLEERLAGFVLQGSKEGLIKDLKLALEKYKPMEIINGPLMQGMEKVGKLFNQNKLIVAEVLQSAEVMKASVSFLEDFMGYEESICLGKVLLATVKGDVHDIGKNLVEIIFTNNGFEVVDLGIKVAPEKIIAALREHKPDILGLSSLLVKSAQQMAITVSDLKHAGFTLPILCGGAALTGNFIKNKVAPAYGSHVYYAKDAMKGLALAKEIIKRGDSEDFVQIQAEDGLVQAETSVSKPTQESFSRSSEITLEYEIPRCPGFERKILEDIKQDDVYNFINPQMLYAKHLGFKGNFRQALEAKDEKALHLQNRVRQIQKIHADGLFSLNGVYQFFYAKSNKNELHLFNGEKKEVCSFHFPRQAREHGICLSDLVLPESYEVLDCICAFVISCGKGIREQAEKYKQQGEYLDSHIVQALALETAEALAEYLHKKIRESWGFSDPAALTVLDIFRAKYRGCRYSFGYPACPDLELQKGLFKLLRPEERGIRLTENNMMDPEASVSALVFHHPDARYFSV